jgi:hypothetical protein
MSFSKMKDRNVKQFLAGGWYQWEGKGHKEKVKEGNMVEILCTRMKIEQ